MWKLNKKDFSNNKLVENKKTLFKNSLSSFLFKMVAVKVCVSPNYAKNFEFQIKKYFVSHNKDANNV